MIFMGNGDRSEDLCNDRQLRLLDLFSHLSGLQQGVVDEKEWNKYKKKCKKFVRQLKFDLIKADDDQTKIYNDLAFLERIRPAFQTLIDTVHQTKMEMKNELAQSAIEMLQEEIKERDAPF